MSETAPMNPAEQAAEQAMATVYDCIENRQNFRLEAGAGAGKTYSLIAALRYIIDKHGMELVRKHQQVACITYTNVARDEIESRTDGHPAILSSTIHSFCWSLIRDFQPFLRAQIPTLGDKWLERIDEEADSDIGERDVVYNLGYPGITDDSVLLHHNDVLSLTAAIMVHKKFRDLLRSRYPILFIDEYQDTDAKFAVAINTHLLGDGEGPLVGLFGDHWQKIYDDGCGCIVHDSLKVIAKRANFRSVQPIVEVLNRIRAELPQQVRDPESQGTVEVYHTNEWNGERRKGSHWKGDLPSSEVTAKIDTLKVRLADQGWNFSPDVTKILMLTHNVLADQQGYRNLAEVFSKKKEAYTKKEDDHIKFFVDVLEPMCAAYQNRQFGKMFKAYGGRMPAIRKPAEKSEWTQSMDKLLELRTNGTIGDVLDHLKSTRRPSLSEAVERKERDLEQADAEQLSDEEQSSTVKRLQKLRTVEYKEIIALTQFIDEKTPFSTKHGVKGAEFENVLVILGRGWSKYNFNQFFEWAADVGQIPADKIESFERNRNLFYVACSRPKTRLALLITQELSDRALQMINSWFGPDNVYSKIDD